MKKTFLLIACLMSLGLAFAQTLETVNINGASNEGFITGMTFNGGNVQLTYEDGSQSTVDMATLTIDFDYVALLNDANDAKNQVMLNTFGGKTIRVELTRTIEKEQWNTLCLPFDMTSTQIATVFGEGTQVAIFNGAENGVVDFATTVGITAGIPYLIYPTTTVSTIALDDIELKDLTDGGSMSNTDYAFIGTMATVTPTGDNYYIDTDDKVKKLSEGESIKAFRAYLSSNGAEIKAFSIDGVVVGAGLLGDVNGDGLVNITDVVLLVDYILDKQNPSFIVGNADINSDGTINISDVTLLVNIIMEKD